MVADVGGEDRGGVGVLGVVVSEGESLGELEG